MPPLVPTCLALGLWLETSTQIRTGGVQQTMPQHFSALQERVPAMENHMEAMDKTLERWEPQTWECLRDMVQELCERNGQAKGEA